MIKLYGSARSRAARCMWMLEELDLTYEHIPVSPPEASTQMAGICPTGKVPALTDGPVTLFESLAINLYLAQTYGRGRLWPSTDIGMGLVYQWTLWAATEIENPIITIVVERLFRQQPDEAAIAASEKALPRPLKVLDTHLSASRYLTGDSFNAADLNVASILASARIASIDLSGYPAVTAWLDRCLGRPAYAAVNARR